jgi:lipid-A-disaccharide synthase
MKYFFIVGEKSGDLHAANLCLALKKEDPSFSFSGWGGARMQAADVHILKDIGDLSIMGFWEVLKNIFKIMGFFLEAKKQILASQPDVIVLVDYAGFNLRVAKWAKKKGFKVVYYIAPKAWAWQANRAEKIKKYVDRLLVIFPFEKAFFDNYGIHTTYVGNPLMDEIKTFSVDGGFLEKNGLDSRPIIALLPGSRSQEIKMMLSTIKPLCRTLPEYQWVVAGISQLPQVLYSHLPTSVRIFHDQTYQLLAHAQVAVVTSGTATLETALLNVPQVVVYKTSFISFQIAKKLIKIKFISLVNLVAQKEVVKELIQDNFNAGQLEAEVKRISKNGPNRERILQDYAALQEQIGPNGASQKAAKEIVSFLLISDNLKIPA